jgi:NADH:ubiquinone oxidoreductase subunit 4 (subunit M)
VFFSQFFIALSIALNKEFDLSQIILYLSGGVVSAVVGYFCLSKIEALDKDINLNKYHGYAFEHPRLALVFLLSGLGLVAFPITPAFIGFDVLLTHINKDQVVLIISTSLCFVFTELSILRIYARVFLGQHKKAYHAIAYRSS